MEKVKTINDVLEKGKVNCCGCYSCYNICPVDAITMESDEKGFSYPIIDETKCINCSLCYKVCPTENAKPEEEKEISSIATYSKNNKERLNSSSGGIFSLLAKLILNNGGIVYGAAFNTKNNVEHIGVEKEEQLEKIRKSKYLQSEIGDTYKNAKENLEKGRMVLFTGTPCQIEGLYYFLQKDYKNLYTQDIVCHGVPSKQVWQKYLQELDKDNKINLENDLNINFRNKDTGWKKYNFKIINRKTKEEFKELARGNVYMQVFLNNLSLRDSCFDCKFKKKYRISDMSLSDYWGSQIVEKDFDDDRGLSLVNINSKKGKELFDNIKEDLIFKETNFDEAVKYNPCWIKSTWKNKYRDKFFMNLDKHNLDKLIKKYRKRETLIRKVKKLVGKIKRKVFN